MKHSMAYVWGFLVGILCVGLITALIAWIVYKINGSKRGKYDERQELARGRAFKFAYTVLVVYLMGTGIFNMMTGIRWCDEFTYGMIGVLSSVFVYACICIWNDAYININQKPVTVILILGGIGLINLLISLQNLKYGAWYENGMLTFRSVNLMCAVSLLLLTIMFVVKLLVDKHREE